MKTNNLNEMKVLFKSTIIFYYLFLLLSCNPVSRESGNNEKCCDGEIKERIKLVSDRILFGDIPSMTSDFILADISLKPEFKRRFTEFSGDISGRYFNTFSSYPAQNNPVDIHQLMNEALTYQHSDGRFGDPDLLFDSENLEGKQMALLWGNGRLLVGLMDYYNAYHKPEVLVAAKKLGDFLNGITDNCVSPEIVEKFKDKNAMGYICFTQLMEGLVNLWDKTKEDKYLSTATRVYSLLPGRGKQHSHGYLNTLMGTLMLYDRTDDSDHLDFVVERYDELIHSTDYLITGGVPEYFGSVGVAKDARDEGCSEADFLMLSLRLWETTGDVQYLEKAEHCLVNHLFANQYQTGDFGHKYIEPKMGFRVDKNIARSWWCCNFHSLRALNETNEYILTKEDNLIKLNLFFDGEIKDDNIQVSVTQDKNLSNKLNVGVLKADKDSRLAVRVPEWAKKITIKSSDKVLKTNSDGDYVILDKKLNTGDKIEIEFEYKLKLVGKRNNEIQLPISKKMEAAIFYGPYLMSADGVFQPFFDSEPNYTNYVEIPDQLNLIPESAPESSRLKDAYIKLEHTHSEMYGKYPVIIRPICETTWQSPGNTRFWFTVASPNQN